MKIRCLSALCVGSAMTAPSGMLPVAQADDVVVKNGSFDQEIGKNPAWFRSDPCLEQIGLPDSGCNDLLPERQTEAARFISIGPSVVHEPEAIELGTLPLPVGIDGATGGSCAVGPEERLSVLRMRLNHPNAPFENLYTGDIGEGVGNVFQTDVFLPGMEGEALDGHAVILRFDHLGLHPTGGAALRVLLIAERIRDEDGEDVSSVDWGATPDLMPFRMGVDTGYYAFEMNSLGSAFFECDGQVSKMPRQLPLDCGEIVSACDDSICAGGESGISLKPSILPEAISDEMPFAGWRTNELKVAVKRLPDWNCSGGLEQLDDYRFTIAFTLPYEAVYLGPDNLMPCPGDERGYYVVPSSSYRESSRAPAYSEIDEVALGLALVDEGDFRDCDFSYDGVCNATPSSNPCPSTISSGGQTQKCKYKPRNGARPLEWDLIGDDVEPIVGGPEPARVPRALAYSSADSYEHTVQVSPNCMGGLSFTIYRRRLLEFDFDLVEFLEPSSTCVADFNGNGLVDGGDLGILLNDFNCEGECVADLNGDGIVNGADLGLLGVYWGPCP